MLRVRVFPQHYYPVGIEAPGWDSFIKSKDEKKDLEKFGRLKTDATMQGEPVELKFSDGQVGGCNIEGSLLAIEIFDNETSHQVDIYIGANKWRTW